MEYNLMKYVSDGLVVMIPVLYILGVLLKKSRIKDEIIPWFLLLVASILCSIIGKDIVQGIIQGVLVTGVCPRESAVHTDS